MVNVAVNGVGTIGKRVAEAVKKQDDLELFCIADVAPTGQLRTLLSEEGPLHGTPLYGSNAEGAEKLSEAGMHVDGKLEDVMEEIDIVVDATPPGIDEKNKEHLYKPNDAKAIFQGGADPSIAPVAFKGLANYEEAKGEDFVKVVSCNTTSLSRTLYTVDSNFGVEKATANLVRRGGDIPQDSRGPINSTIPVTDVPSHHGPDVKAVMPDLEIKTLAVKVPVTYGHVHMVTVELEHEIGEEDALEAFDEAPRINLVEADQGFDSTGKVHEQMRDLHRERSDMPEAGVWKETVTVEGNTLYWIHMVHQESIVVPPNIDAIRSMCEIEDQDTSIEKTNEALGIG